MSDFPDFHIPHAEKIEWMIETSGWAYESVAPVPSAEPPTPSYGYTIGVGEMVGFAEIVVFGLTPSAGHGLVEMLVGLLAGGTELPVGPELVGVLDNDLRCRFAPMSEASIRSWLPVSVAWHSGEVRPAVQLLYPDRAGYLPYEDGFDPRLRYAQPVVGELDEIGYAGG